MLPDGSSKSRSRRTILESKATLTWLQQIDRGSTDNAKTLEKGRLGSGFIIAFDQVPRSGRSSRNEGKAKHLLQSIGSLSECVPN